MSKEIFLTKNMKTIVDDDDYEWLNQFNWFAHRDRLKWYAVRKNNNKQEPMHKTIMNTPADLSVDHINGDSLDNRRCNLRFATQQQQCFNRRKRSGMSSSKYKGVHFHKIHRLWGVSICKDYKKMHLGYFQDEIEAALTYTIAAVKLFGQYAFIDFTPEEIHSRAMDLLETERILTQAAERKFGIQPMF